MDTPGRNWYNTAGGVRMKDEILGGIVGLAVADAVGVPAEFMGRESLARDPVTGMRGYGSHRQPPGTWSDDTSLTLCLLDSLTNGLDYEDIMRRFLGWMENAGYTARGRVFDIGIATRGAISRFSKGVPPRECGGRSEYDNGNGALMRILPLGFYLRARFGEGFLENEEAVSIVRDACSLTHAHIRNQIACGIYLSVADALIGGMPLERAVRTGVSRAKGVYEARAEDRAELKHFDRIFSDDFAELPREGIRSGGYVVDTLEAALWCLLTTDSYEGCVLKAVNLGDDTDTVAAVAGGLAGMHYGYGAVPAGWVKRTARRAYIRELCEAFHRSLLRMDNPAF